MQMTLDQLMRTGWQAQNSQNAPKPLKLPAICVEFDGGARHVPGIAGYGMGYGSFRYNGGKAVRVEMNRLMSANAAEIWTASAAIHRIAQEWEPSEVAVSLWGDSTIAIKWILVQAKEKAIVPFVGKTTLSKGASDEMKHAITSLELLREFRSVAAYWHSRRNSVVAFGH